MFQHTEALDLQAEGFFRGLLPCFASYRDKWSFKLLDVIQSNASVSLFQVADAGFFASKLKTLEDPKVGKHLVTTEAVSRQERGSMENFSGSNRIAGLYQIEQMQ